MSEIQVELPTMAAAMKLIEAQLRRADTGWSCGSFGAIAEFHRDADEPVDLQIETDGNGVVAGSAVTARGAIRIAAHPSMLPLAYEMTSRQADSWQQGVSLCLPELASSFARRDVLTELGPDAEALRPQDRAAVLFDVGLDLPHVQFCVRTDDADCQRELRALCGTSVLADGSPAMAAFLKFSPHRVAICPFGRVEVFQPIPAPGGKSPEGPHTHLLPQLLKHRRSHAATVPMLDGWIPCMSLFPANPLRDSQGQTKPFDAADHARFQEILAEFGARNLLATKRAVIAALESTDDPAQFPMPESRFDRIALRVALRQAGYRQPPLAKLATWRQRFDNGAEEEAAG